MSHIRCIDLRHSDSGLLIPPLPRPAPRARWRFRSALQEASLVGSLALALSWGAAELALLLGGY